MGSWNCGAVSAERTRRQSTIPDRRPGLNTNNGL